MIKISTSLCGGLLILGLYSCSMIKAYKAVQSATLNQKNFNVEMPIDYPVSHIVLHVGLNGSKNNYEFVFDTGAGGTVISQNLADKLGLKVVSTLSVKDGQGITTQKKVVMIPELDVSGLKFYNVGAIVSDYGPSSAINCIAKDGIIGVNIISKCNWTVNYERQTLTAT